MAAKDMRKKKQEARVPFFAWPAVGTVLTVTSGLSFLFLLMILPVVGPAAMKGSGSPGATTAPQIRENMMAFTGVLMLSLVLAVLAVVSKLQRRKIDGSPLPYYSVGLCVADVFILVVYVTGLLAL